MEARADFNGLEIVSLKIEHMLLSIPFHIYLLLYASYSMLLDFR